MTAPKLRFDGFDSDWTLDSIGAVISNKSKKYDPEKSEIDFPCIELEHLSQQTGEILGTVSAKDQKSIKNVFDENSVLFGKLRPYLRKFAKPKFQGVCSSEIWVLTSKKMQSNFLFQYVQTDGFSELTQIQVGSKMPRADWGSISNGEILFPIFEEQTKIASFLSAVDEKINQLTQKHQLLSQYKQGMMQKLFSQQIRFKADDGSEFGEWEETRLAKVSLLITKGTTPKIFTDGNINFLKIEALSNGKFVVDKCQKIDQITHEKELKRSMLQEKDILFAIAGATIGKNGIVDKDILPANTNQALAIIRLLADVNHVFVSKVLNSYLMEKYIEENISVGAQPNLNLQQMGNFSFSLPCLEEQTKIANFLSAFDQKIDVVSQQIAQAKQWKKGLLQQMFV